MQSKRIIPIFATCIALSAIILIVCMQFATVPQQLNETKDPITSFSNDGISGTLRTQITPIVPSMENGMKIQGNEPSVLFNDSFEATTINAQWDAYANAVLDTGQAYLSTRSIKLTTGGSDATLTHTGNIVNESEAIYQFSFFLRISKAYSGNDYLALQIKFTNGNYLVYLLDGNIATPGSKKIIDISADYTMYKQWIGIYIEDLQMDYYHQFSNTTMPSLDEYEFISHCTDGSVHVNIDDFMLQREPRIYQVDSYWAYTEDNDRLWAWAVDMYYNVTISDTINASNVWIEFTVYGQIEDGDGNPILEWSFLQDDIVQVTQFNQVLTWLGRIYQVPEDNAFGDTLYFNYTIQVTAMGQIKNSTHWAEAKATDTDGILMWWIEIEGSISLEIYAVVGTVSTISTLGAVKGTQTIRLKRRAKRYEYDPINEQQFGYENF